MSSGLLTGLSVGGNIAGNLLSAGLQNRWNRKAWERANKYNHPKQQIKRLKEAGISPSMFYSGGNLTAATVQQTPKVDSSLGVGEGLDKSQKLRAQSVSEKLSTLELEGLQIRNEGMRLDNREKRKDLNYYEADRQFRMSTTAEKLNLQGRQLQIQRDWNRVQEQIQREANSIKEYSSRVDHSRFVHKREMDHLYAKMQQTKNKAEVAQIKQNMVVSMAKLAIAEGNLDISKKDLAIRLQNHDWDRALHKALDEMIEKGEWTKQQRAGYKAVANLIIQALK